MGARKLFITQLLHTKHGLHSIIHPDGFALHHKVDAFNFQAVSSITGWKWNHAGTDLLLPPASPPSSITCLVKEVKEENKLLLKTELAIKQTSCLDCLDAVSRSRKRHM